MFITHSIGGGQVSKRPSVWGYGDLTTDSGDRSLYQAPYLLMLPSVTRRWSHPLITQKMVDPSRDYDEVIALCIILSLAD